MIRSVLSGIVSLVLGDDLEVRDIRDMPNSALSSDIGVLNQYGALMANNRLGFLLSAEPPSPCTSLTDLSFPSILRRAGIFDPSTTGANPAQQEAMSSRISDLLCLVAINDDVTSPVLSAALRVETISFGNVLSQWQFELKNRARIGALPAPGRPGAR